MPSTFPDDERCRRKACLCNSREKKKARQESRLLLPWERKAAMASSSPVLVFTNQSTNQSTRIWIYGTSGSS